MKLDFSEIVGASRVFSCENTGWYSWPEELVGGELVAHYSVVRQNNEAVVLAGSLTGCCVGTCVSCGEKVNLAIQSEFAYTLTTKEEIISDLAEVEFEVDDLMTVYLEEPVVDVEELLREQAELSLPLRVECREDCKGICAGCGVLLNEQKCQCSPYDSTSPFAVLKKLSQR
ncbi:DUF177 domain-containing protein [Desulfotalea psychrophila]|uniref:DUF177 domain-containing protein n=1 Tax=Desulfotalea psychrophila (strain LSv54 / DSM 12343) TaxID=177439 RepID=Q6AJF5_DESPS|nr:DUF177 domain-containing protein [Desulfotalea psychrophila]CAG37525.1 hypothetical protein DP2796 [Desulfotalea psychrophila LSv54]